MSDYVKDVLWSPNSSASSLVESLKNVGFQSIHLGKGADIVYKMKKENAKIILSFPSNLVTTGLRGFFAQLISLGFVDMVVTTAGSIEEDIMKAIGERFYITRFEADDIDLYEKGYNRIGNLYITTDSYMKLEGFMHRVLEEIYKERKHMATCDLLWEIGKRLNDKNSILRQAYLKKVPIFCPAIADGAIGFHLFMLKQDHKDFIVDVIDDFGRMISYLTYDDKKGLIALGGGVSKHYALLATLINGGTDYAVYITTSSEYSGSLSGATTNEGKSWGKISSDADSITIRGDATILFPLMMFNVLDRLHKEGEIQY